VLVISAEEGWTQTPSTCTAQAEMNVTRRGGRAERVADFVLTCLNPSTNPFGTEAVLMLETGQGVSYTSGLRDAVILLNEAPPAQQVRGQLNPTSPNAAANVFVGGLAEFDRNFVIFSRIPIAPDSQGRFRTRIANVRIDTANLPRAVTLVTGPEQSVRVPIRFKGSNEGGAPFVDPPALSLTEVEPRPFSFDVVTAAALHAGDAEQGSGAPLTIAIAETFPAAAKKRIETTGGPEPAGTPVVQNVPGRNYYTESGFVPAGQDLSTNAAGVADSGTRFVVQLQTSSAQVSFQVPQCVPAQGTLGMALRQVTGFAADFSGGALASSCGMSTVALQQGQANLVYEVVGDAGVHGGETLDSYSIPVSATCTPRAALGLGTDGVAQSFGTMLVRVGPGPVRAPAAALSSDRAQTARVPYPSFDGVFSEEGINLDPVCAASGGKPAFTSNGFTDAAAFGKPPSGGGLASLFGNFGASLAIASTIPLPLEIAGVSVTFQNIAAAASKAQAAPLAAPLLFVSPGQINLQIPWEVNTSPGRVRAVVTVGGVSSDPVELPVASLSPGIFTVESGPGHAIAINPDGSLAHPAGAIPGYASRPVRLGEALIILATGLGVTRPAAVTGSNSYDNQGAFVRRDTVETPRVTIAGVEQTLVFAGMSPEFVGVNQINIVVRSGTPAGGAQPLIIQSGGLSSRNDVTVAVAAN
jgi:uncharacterized protein (TIGR03437 family)